MQQWLKASCLLKAKELDIAASRLPRTYRRHHDHRIRVGLRFVSIRQHTSAYVSIRQHKPTGDITITAFAWGSDLGFRIRD